jgi:putative DNA primase/helicase
MRCVSRLGWYNSLYILPQETLGNSPEEEVVFQASVPLAAHHESKGSLTDWQENISKYCVDNSRLCFCVSVGFAAPLLHLLGEENGGFNLRGPSSGGKTTALKVALSVYGGEKMLHSWRATSNGLESIAALHNDCLLCLDELGKLEPKIAGEIAYFLANGGGKQRSDKSGFARKKQNWRLLFLSSGEIGIPDLIRQAGQKVRGGHEVRVIDIPAFTGQYGVFDYLHSCPSGDAFSRMLGAHAESYHGTAGKAFISELIKNIPGHITHLRESIDLFKKENTPPNADGQELRVLNRFALIAAAGFLATRLEITGWPQDEAGWAAKECFASWLKNRGGLTAQESLEVLRQIRLF